MDRILSSANLNSFLCQRQYLAWEDPQIRTSFLAPPELQTKKLLPAAGPQEAPTSVPAWSPCPLGELVPAVDTCRRCSPPPPLPSLSASSPGRPHPSRGFRPYPQAQGFHVSSAARAPQVPDPQPLPVGPLSHWPADAPPTGPSRVGRPSLLPARFPTTSRPQGLSQNLYILLFLLPAGLPLYPVSEKIVSSQGHWVRGGWGFWPSAEP